MRPGLIRLVSIGSFLVLSCAQPRDSVAVRGDFAGHRNAALTVQVTGNVNRPGWIELTPPLTVDHAVELAGGVSSDPEHTKAARVARTDGQQFVVRRSAWMSFALHDGDEINIPKRIFP